MGLFKKSTGFLNSSFFEGIEKNLWNSQTKPDGVRGYRVAWASSRLLPATSLTSGLVRAQQKGILI